MIQGHVTCATAIKTGRLEFSKNKDLGFRYKSQQDVAAGRKNPTTICLFLFLLKLICACNVTEETLKRKHLCPGHVRTLQVRALG